MIMMLMTTVQSKQNSYDDLSTVHTNLQTQFDALKNSIDTLDKQHLIKTATKATGEATQYKLDLAKSNELLKEMVGVTISISMQDGCPQLDSESPATSHAQLDQWE